MEATKTELAEKIRESAVSVLPILILVSLLCLFLTPMQPQLLLAFLIGALMLILGMGLFSLGAEQSMTPIGTKIGTALTKTKNLPLILGVSFLLGFAITVAEPDLQVLAETVPHISSTVLLVTVGIGVGLFMSLCMYRIITGANLRWLLLGCYALIFLLAAFTDPDFLCIAFDSGGVTTGPMTVPFILAMGMGVANIRSDNRAEADSFGLVALCSIGPILSVLLLGFFYDGGEAVAELSHTSLPTTTAIGVAFLAALPVYFKEMAIAMLPIVGIFLIFQLALLRLTRRRLVKILIGLLYTYLGLVALCSIGPILSVLLLGFFYDGGEAVAELSHTSLPTTTAIGVAFLAALPVYFKEMAIAMLPIVGIFLIFQLALLRLTRRRLVKILIGLLYTYLGLVLFLTGVNIGFSTLGAELGAALGRTAPQWLIPLAIVLGWFIISAEPAVSILEKQIETVSAGAIPGKAIKRSLSIAIAIAMGLAMLRVLTGISILWFVVPGYAAALALSFLVPDIYTAIAFDSGGVASGPMTATFMLQLVMGASIALGGNVLRDAFGVVALVAMMPLLSIQLVGFLYERRAKRTAREAPVYGDLDIIELWEDAG